MTDTLRTRAWEAARVASIPCGHAEAPPYREGFEDGALWHAAQQPTREEIAPKVCPEHHEASGTAHDPGNSIACAWSDDITDAVLALYENGAGS